MKRDLKALKDLIEGNLLTIMMLIIASGLIIFDVFIGGIPQSTFLLSILIILTLLIIESLMSRLQVGKKIDQLSLQVVEGNPDVIFKFEEYNSSLVKISSQAKEDLLIIANDLVGFLSTESHVLVRALTRGVRIRVLLPDLNNKDLLIWSSLGLKGEDDFVGLQKDVEYSLISLQKIQDVTNLDNTNKLEIRLSQLPFQFTGLLIDPGSISSAILVSFSTLNKIPSNIYFTLYRQSSSDIFERFSSSFETLWAKSRHYQISNSQNS